MIGIDFEFNTKYGKFSDTIWYDADSPMSDAELETEKQRRLSNWLSIIETPPQEPING